MNALVTAVAPELDAPVDQRFGRGAYFVIVDTETLAWEAHQNEGPASPGGAGSQAAQFAGQRGVDVVISGGFGPNAYAALAAAGIPMELAGSAKTVREAVTMHQNGQLETVAGPSRPGHLGSG
jgi:predicted Fe-Mo cluster-binding NifX family protein